jgi:EAL domain-containing protein (putative c-di-GMP-specific phosphodiesterase class I)
VAISLDDFGTGYSSLSYLRKLPLHKIKIDRSFTQDVLNQADCAAIIRGVIRMAADLGISSVGEGVEDAKQLEWLRQNGCSEAQGYLISAPLYETEFKNFIAAWNPKTLAA